MAVAAPARRASAPATAPPPSRTSPPRKRRAAPRDGAAAPAPVRRKPARAPSRKAPARKPSRRAKTGARVAAGGHLIPIAVGRTAVAVRDLPDSGLVVRLTRGRAWIAVLGVLLVGIVALNVVTLSFAASSSKVDERNTTLEQENSALRSRLAQHESTKKMRHAAAERGLAMPMTAEPTVIKVQPDVVAKAAQRLAEVG
jgi:hypothetical protein